MVVVGKLRRTKLNIKKVRIFTKWQDIVVRGGQASLKTYYKGLKSILTYE